MVLKTMATVLRELRSFESLRMSGFQIPFVVRREPVLSSAEGTTA
jgi:hypothetical protein